MSEDITDIATERAQVELDRAIEWQRQQSAAPAPPPSEECWNLCGENPRPGSRYCSPECLEDHSRMTNMKKRQGKA